MRRIAIIIIAVVVVGVAGYFIFGRKGGGGSPKSTAADAGQGKGSVRGQTEGKLKPKSREEKRAEKKRLRKEERQRRREERRREREKRRRLREARSKRGRRRTKRRGSKGTLYVVRAVVSLGAESYALFDGRRVGVGDVVMGRKIVSIQTDKVEVEAFGKRSFVRVGESIMPATFDTKRSRRR